MSQQGGEQSADDIQGSVFCDTGILINYMNREWERDHTSELMESSPSEIVISESVEDEFTSIIDRRNDLYLDFIDFVLEEQGKIEEYSPRGKRTKNDYSHIIDIQQRLASMDKMEAAKRLRRFGRAYERRADHLLEALIEDIVWTAPPMPLTFALRDVIDNSNDATIVSEAADWSNEGGTGNFAALDKQDILDLGEEINTAIEEEIGANGRLKIRHPTAFA